MLMEKKTLNFEELDAQTALELPSREMPLITLVLVDLVDIGDVTITVRNINVAAQICAAVGGILTFDSPTDQVVECTVDQR
jgi:hypothetical protein